MPSLVQIGSILAERASKKNDITFRHEMEDLAIIKYGRFLANRLERNPGMDKYYLRAFDVPLKPIDKDDECLTSVDGCGKIMRSIDPIPDPVKYGAHLFNYVGAPGGYQAYGWTTFGTEPRLRKLPLIGGKARHTRVNSYLYIFNKDIDKARVEGVFPDPRLLAVFLQCGGNKPCYDAVSDALIDEQTAELIIKDILMNELRLLPVNEKVQIKTDKNV